MIWALRDDDQRTEARPGEKGRCPCCKSEVVAKCGEIVSWHWAHKISDCDPWYEPESEWHLEWKRKFPQEWQEVVLGAHRADIKTPKLVVELQASGLSSWEIQDREQYYQNMVWVLRGTDFEKNFDLRQRDGFLSFRWRRPRKSWWGAKKDIIVDFDTELFHIKKLYPGIPCGGWGVSISEREFLVRCGASVKEST